MVLGDPGPAIEVMSPAADEARRALRTYFDDVAGRHYSRQATEDEIANLRLLVTQAGGTGPEQALSGAFAAVAARSGRHLIMSDVVPPRASDAQALSSWFVVLSGLIPSLAAGSASAMAFRRARRAWSVAAPVAACVRRRRP